MFDVIINFIKDSGGALTQNPKYILFLVLIIVIILIIIIISTKNRNDYLYTILVTLLKKITVFLLQLKKFLNKLIFICIHFFGIYLVISDKFVNQMRFDFIITIFPDVNLPFISEIIINNFTSFYLILLIISDLILLILKWRKSVIIFAGFFGFILGIYKTISQGLWWNNLIIVNNILIKIQKSLTEEDCSQLFHSVINDKFTDVKFDSEMSFESFYLYLKQHNIEDYDHICKYLDDYLKSHIYIEEVIDNPVTEPTYNSFLDFCYTSGNFVFDYKWSILMIIFSAIIINYGFLYFTGVSLTSTLSDWIIKNLPFLINTYFGEDLIPIDTDSGTSSVGVGGSLLPDQRYEFVNTGVAMLAPGSYSMVYDPDFARFFHLPICWRRIVDK